MANFDKGIEHTVIATSDPGALRVLRPVNRNGPDTAEQEPEERELEEAVAGAEDDLSGELRQDEDGIDEPVRMPGHDHPTAAFWHVAEPADLDLTEEDAHDQAVEARDDPVGTRRSSRRFHAVEYRPSWPPASSLSTA